MSSSFRTPLGRRATSEMSLSAMGGDSDDDDTGDERFLRDIQTLSRALSLVPRRSSGDIACPEPKPEPERKAEHDDENSYSGSGSGHHKAQSQLTEVAKLKSRRYTLLELLKGYSEEGDCDETEYAVIEQGVEVSSTDGIGESTRPDQVTEEDRLAKETEPAFVSLSVRGSEEIVESPKIEENLTDLQSYVDRKSNRDSAILSMLGIHESSSESSFDSDPDSPREQLWKQFKKEVLASSNGIFRRDSGEETVSQDYETKPELNQAVNNKSNAETVEDEEVETSMRELNHAGLLSNCSSCRNGNLMAMDASERASLCCWEILRGKQCGK